MSLITGIQDQKDHITQVKKDDKVSPKEKYANRIDTIKKSLSTFSSK